MATVPFEGLSPAQGVDHARWVVASLQGQDGVARVVPGGFDAYARVMHPLDGGRRWSTVAPGYLEGGTDWYEYPFPDEVSWTEGDMGESLADVLLDVLGSATGLHQPCHFALWEGWGDLHAESHSHYLVRDDPGPLGAWRRRAVRRMVSWQRRAEAPLYEFVAACAVQPWWGGRNMLLFDGPIGAVAAIGTPDPLGSGVCRRGPQWWWPAGRAWFVATEIDYPWTYVAGPRHLVDAVIQHPDVEAVPIQHDHAW